jgi:hypothetical protein
VAVVVDIKSLADFNDYMRAYNECILARGLKSLIIERRGEGEGERISLLFTIAPHTDTGWKVW